MMNWVAASATTELFIFMGLVILGFLTGLVILGICYYRERIKSQGLQFQIQIQAQVQSQVQVAEAARAAEEIRAVEDRARAEASQIEALRQENHQLRMNLARLEEGETHRLREFDNRVRLFNDLHSRVEMDRARILSQEQERTAQQMDSRRRNWSIHQKSVIDVLKTVTLRWGFEGYDENQSPLELKPDFVIKMGDQWVVFDAKAPQDPERLDYFPAYLDLQMKRLEKYANLKDVRKDMFLVVPLEVLGFLAGVSVGRSSLDGSNSNLTTVSHNIKGYNVHIVVPQMLDVVLGLLRRIEDFQCIEILGPDQVEEVATHVGRMARLVKRRVQVDQYFAEEFSGVLATQARLPVSIRDISLEKEKGFIFNPPLQKRGQRLSIPLQVESHLLHQTNE